MLVVQNKTVRSLIGTNYIFVNGKGNPTENATELQEAYDTAKTKSPSASNKITVVIAPGKYDFGATAFIHDTEYIDIVSLTGEADVYLSSTQDGVESWHPKRGITVTADNSLVKGINCGSLCFVISNLPNSVCVNCKGGNQSFGGTAASGTFNNCTGGNDSFGAHGDASGTFNYCTGGQFSFGGAGSASGTFNNCTGGNDSFGGGGMSDASGTFNNCTGDDYSFGGAGSALGTFNNCTGGDYSFGGDGGAPGTFINCIGAYQSFGGGSMGSASGTFNYCTSGTDSFGGFAASGTFNNCTGDDYSFGGSDYGDASGTFNNCTGGQFSFGGGDYSFGSGGTASGTFNNCTGGEFSFGNTDDSITVTARLYYCKSGGSFPTPASGGRLILCIDGSNDIVTV